MEYGGWQAVFSGAPHCVEARALALRNEMSADIALPQERPLFTPVAKPRMARVIFAR